MSRLFNSRTQLMFRLIFLAGSVFAISPTVQSAELKTWDGRHSISNIAVTVAYFVPRDRQPLPDWHDRVSYFAKRIEQFHTREFQGQSTLKANVLDEPFTSARTTEQLRAGDANFIFFQTLKEVDQELQFGRDKVGAFPILLVLSEINWRSLDDFFRVSSQDGQLKFEGQIIKERHFPGARSGGSRATYLADRGVGWGLVSADGWRVPYRGSDCVIYHEGCGHTVGLPHPDKGNNSVMSQAQYVGWLSESWINDDQKSRLNWKPQEKPMSPDAALFSKFRAIPQPPTPKPNQEVRLAFDWPDGAKVTSLRTRIQTAIGIPWIEVPQSWQDDAPDSASLGSFDRATPVSYRIDATLEDGSTTELWGYFQVRENPRVNPQPLALSQDLLLANRDASHEVISELPADEVDLLALANVDENWMQGKWTRETDNLSSPKQPGARIELPYSPPEEYRLKLIVEPLDSPHGLLLGQRSGGNRFAVLVNFDRDEQVRSALENIDGRNVGNDSTFTGQVFKQDRLSQVVVTVTKKGVSVSVDGNIIIHWTGDANRLSLSDYWATPRDSAIFLGTYDCRYRFHRVTMEPISGNGTVLD